MIIELLSNNLETIIAVLALVIALQANVLARMSKSDSDRMLLSEKKRDLLQQIDRQHVTMLRLRFVMQGQLLQFELCPDIALLQPDEKERVEANLDALDQLEESCLQARSKAERIDVTHDPAAIDFEFADLGRLTAHLQKDLEHEQALLEGKKYLVATAHERSEKRAPDKSSA